MLHITEAYVLGYAPARIAFHFEGLEMLSRLHSDPTPALQQRVQAALAEWPSRGPAIVNDVRNLESTLRRYELAVPPPPRDMEGYYQWGDAISVAVNGYLTDHPELPVEQRLAIWPRKWAYALGARVGSAAETIDLAVLARHLLDAAPGNAFLRAQSQQLAALLAQSHAGIPKVVESIRATRTLPEDACAAADRFAALLGQELSNATRDHATALSNAVWNALPQGV